MGNQVGGGRRRRPAVEERYTRPQGLYPHPDIDLKKLRRLILEAKLAPCYPGSDDPRADLDECPICFLFYPSLNRSKCCAKGICTECFLQMRTPTSCRPTQCPYCKMASYAVEYRGVKTMEEKGNEQIEEQRVIEAQIRMRQQELQDDAERMKKKQAASLTNAVTTAQVEHRDTGGASTTVAALAEQQHIYGEASSTATCHTARCDILSRSDRSFTEDLSVNGSGSLGARSEEPLSNKTHQAREGAEYSNERWSEVAEASSSFTGSDLTIEAGAANSGGSDIGSGSIPDSFEEQMMLAMALSLGDARAKASSPGMIDSVRQTFCLHKLCLHDVADMV
ncbi:hypothetical protein E2562_003483 [Oryza meyeriana var. granulata]|uniref:RING-type domain-containing protein n=1 Tax=Oryza meyeriana var. granulata TaxID=110450 RepID=A0A6G1CMX7_9ORYZ|nr:hypothetical protein E2562_003483 [Oryza meyeriana var. granulata]